jgi:CheY-like chemotaxis protein
LLLFPLFEVKALPPGDHQNGHLLFRTFNGYYQHLHYPTIHFSNTFNMPLKQKIILFADDDLDDQELLKEAFLKIDDRLIIHTHTTGKQTLEFLNSCSDLALPKLIILDYNIPDMNGVEIFKSINLNMRFSGIVTVVWSTSNSPLYRKICKDAGIEHYFQKPQRYQEILMLGQRMLELIPA